MGYIVTLGTPIGRNGGVVTAIEPQRVVVEERVLDFYGKEQVNRIVMETPKEGTELGGTGVTMMRWSGVGCGSVRCRLAGCGRVRGLCAAHRCLAGADGSAASPAQTGNQELTETALPAGTRRARGGRPRCPRDQGHRRQRPAGPVREAERAARRGHALRAGATQPAGDRDRRADGVGARPAPSSIAVENPMISEIRVGRDEGKIRLTVALRGDNAPDLHGQRPQRHRRRLPRRAERRYRNRCASNRLHPSRGRTARREVRRPAARRRASRPVARPSPATAESTGTRRAYCGQRSGHRRRHACNSQGVLRAARLARSQGRRRPQRPAPARRRQQAQHRRHRRRARQGHAAPVRRPVGPGARHRPAGAEPRERAGRQRPAHLDGPAACARSAKSCAKRRTPRRPSSRCRSTTSR